MFDYLVIGKGLIGAAAARYLSAVAAGVAVLGPDEPADPAAHAGAFGSHYDQGRITRRLGSDWVWSWLAATAIAGYDELAQASGVAFHAPVGGLYAAAPSDPYLGQVAAVAERLAAPFERLAAADLARRYPYLRFPAHHEVVFEDAPAGYINPRDLIRAQLTMAERQAATLIDDTAVTVADEGTAFSVTTLTGRRLQARRLLLATGAFTNAYELLPKPLDLRLKTESVVLVRLDAPAAAALAGMPTVIYQIEDSPVADIYLLPPIRYPDGHVYVKLGANTSHDRYLSDREALRDWYIRGDSAAAADLLAALGSVLPDLPLDNWHSHRCLVTYTRTRRPYIGAVIPERLFVAVGGNGRAAKSSDTIGRLAAAVARGAPWPAPLAAALFTPHWQ